MRKWIRWGGLLAFLVVLVGVVVAWLLFVDGVVERMIETQGTRLVGAQVDLDSADLTLVPAGLTLTRLQITNPKEPTTNAVEIGTIAMTLDGLNLVRRKILIEEMTVEGLQFGTPRSSPGAILSKPRDEPSVVDQLKDSVAFTMPSFEIPDVKEILDKEELETLKLAKSLKQDLQDQKDKWKKRLQTLPGKESFAGYKDRLKKLKRAPKGGLGGILGGVGEAQALQEEIQRDLDNLRNAQDNLKAEMSTLKGRLDQVVKAPQADLRRLQEKYSLSPRGIANMSALLLGKRIGDGTRTALAWYEKAQPLVERAKRAAVEGKGPEVVEPVRGIGVDVRFQETDPLPDFLVRRAKVSLQSAIGNLSGEIENITPDQDVLGKPLTFHFSGEKLKSLEAVNLRGNFNHTNPATPHDRINLHAVGYKIAKASLSEQPDWPVVLQKGLADARLRADIKGDGLTANLKGNVRSLEITAGKERDSNVLTQALSSAVSGITSLSLHADITGTLEGYEVKITSDLDRVLQRAAGKLVRDLSNRFQKELSREISRKVDGSLQELRGIYGGVTQIDGELASRLTQGNDVLESVIKKSISPKGLPGGLQLPF